MKKIKNLAIVLMLFMIIFLCGNVNAAGGSMKAGKSKVTVGQTVSVTVSFGGKVNSAQFKLSYDSSKFDYVSCSEGKYNQGTNRYTYLGMDTEPDLASVTFTFKSKQTGSGKFSLSSGMFKNNSGKVTMSNLSTSVTIEEVKSNSSSSSSSSGTKKPTTTKKPNSTKKPTSNTGETNEEQTDPIIVQKAELIEIRNFVAGLIDTDYTEESWKALQEAIANAEAAATQEEYDALKEQLSKDVLQKAPFEKTELDKVLRDLIGLPKENYTTETWDALQAAIVTADNAELKSDYDKIKNKLTINDLILDEKGFIEQIMDDSCGHKMIILTLASAVVILIIAIMILLVMYEKAKDPENLGRRAK